MPSIVTRSRSGAKNNNNDTALTGNMIYQDTDTDSLDDTGTRSSNNSKVKRKKSKNI